MIPSSTRFAVGFVLLTTGCGAGWHQPRESLVKPVPPRQQVQIWHLGRALRWHAVQVTADSITGISYLRPINCDTCRVALPRTTVDSIRFGNPVAGFWKSVAVVVAIPVAFLFIYCSGGCYAN